MKLTNNLARMGRRLTTKRFWLKALSILLALACLCGIVFGAVKLVKVLKDDRKTVNLVYSVGKLDSNGKYVSDKKSIYTVDAFKCEGLEVKMDFDSKIKYQIYFYDDLDTFVECTSVLTGAYSSKEHDAYARIVITPTEDVSKITLLDRLSYGRQLKVTVNKTQSAQYVDIFNARLQIVDDVTELRFRRGVIHSPASSGAVNGKGQIVRESGYNVATTMDVLAVKGGSRVSCTYTPQDGKTLSVFVFEFKKVNGNIVFVSSESLASEITLNAETEFVLFQFGIRQNEIFIALEDNFMYALSNYFVIR